MNDPRRQRFLPYVRQVADLLRLRDWTIDISDTPAHAGSMAAVQLTYGRKLATIYLGEAHLDDSPEGQRHSIVHELIHCHLDPAAEIALEGLAEAAGPHFERMLEYAVDGLADAVAPLMPLPPEPEAEADEPTPEPAPAAKARRRCRR